MIWTHLVTKTIPVPSMPTTYQSLNSKTRIHLDSLVLTWNHLDSLGFTMTHLDSLGLTTTHQTWTHQISLGLTRTIENSNETLSWGKGKRERCRASTFSNSDLTTRPRVRTHERNETISRLGSLPPTSDLGKEDYDNISHTAEDLDMWSQNHVSIVWSYVRLDWSSHHCCFKKFSPDALHNTCMRHVCQISL